MTHDRFAADDRTRRLLIGRVPRMMRGLATGFPSLRLGRSLSNRGHGRYHSRAGQRLALEVLTVGLCISIARQERDFSRQRRRCQWPRSSKPPAAEKAADAKLPPIRRTFDRFQERSTNSGMRRAPGRFCQNLSISMACAKGPKSPIEAQRQFSSAPSPRGGPAGCRRQRHG